MSEKRMWSLGTVLGLYMVSLPVMALNAVPDRIVFDDVSDSAQVTLYEDGVPLSAGAVRGARIMIDDRNYSHQYILSRSSVGEATVTVKPNPQTVEIGTYDLEIVTSHGTIRVPIETTLGVDLERLKEERVPAALPTPTSMRYELPERMTVGQRLIVPGPSRPGADYTWWVNGEVVETGPDGDLDVIMTIPGETQISLTETVRGTQTAHWRKAIQVAAEPAIATTVEKRVDLTLRAPGGYDSYEWRRDGDVIGTGPSLTVSYDTAGERSIELFASDPLSADVQPLRHLRYLVEVR